MEERAELLADNIETLTDTVEANLRNVEHRRRNERLGSRDGLRSVLRETIDAALAARPLTAHDSRKSSSEFVSAARVRAAGAIFDAAIGPTAEHLGCRAPVAEVARLLHSVIWRRLAETAASPAVASPLTERESEVLALVAGALTNRQVAIALHISPGTVKRHIANIAVKLHAVSRLDAVRRAQEQGILHGHPPVAGSR